MDETDFGVSLGVFDSFSSDALVACFLKEILKTMDPPLMTYALYGDFKKCSFQEELN